MFQLNFRNGTRTFVGHPTERYTHFQDAIERVKNVAKITHPDRVFYPLQIGNQTHIYSVFLNVEKPPSKQIFVESQEWIATIYKR